MPSEQMNTATHTTKTHKGPVWMKADAAHFICKTQQWHPWFQFPLYTMQGVNLTF